MPEHTSKPIVQYSILTIKCVGYVAEGHKISEVALIHQVPQSYNSNLSNNDTQSYVICYLGFFFCVRYFYLSSVLQSYFFFFHFLFPNIFCSSTSDLISSPAGLDLDPKCRRSRHQAWRAPYSHGGCRQPGETSFGIQLSQPDWEF